MRVEVLAPNTRRVYWKGYIDLELHRINIADAFVIDAKLVPQIVTGAARGSVKVAGTDGVLVVQAPDNHAGLLYVGGKLARLLGAGVHHYWKFIRDLRMDTVDLRLQVLEVAGQEILTRTSSAASPVTALKWSRWG